MRIMDSTRLHRPKYVHKRAGSGNETATPDTVQGSTIVPDTTSSLTTHLSEQPAKSLIATTSLAEVSSQEVSPTNSATSTSSELPTTSASSSTALVKTPTTSSLPTSISNSLSTNLAPTLVSTPTVIPGVLSSSIPILPSAKGLIQASNAPVSPALTTPSSTEAPSQSVAVEPTSVSTSASAPVSTSTPISASAPAPANPPTSISTSATVSAPAQLPSSSSISSASTETTPSSILVDSSMTGSLTPIAVPSFAPVSSTLSDAIASSIVPPNNALQSPLPVSASTSSAPAPVGASTNSPQSSPSSSSSTSGVTQGNNTMTIVGAAVGSVAGFVFLALLGIWCVRRRYKKNAMIMSPFSKRQSGRDRRQLSSATINEDFRPDPKMLFSKASLSTFDEKDTAPSSRANSPPSRHSRSYTTNSLPPIIPARSVARPLSIAQQPPVLPKLTPNPPQLYQPAESIDTSFMGTISTYFSSTPNIPEEPFSFDANSNKPTSTGSSSIYTQNTTTSAIQSPYASFLPPITPNLPTTITPPTANPPLPSTSPPPIPSPQPFSQSPPPTSSLRASSSALGPSRYQSMGAWRDSMWSTSATPIAPAHLPPGTATTNTYNFFDSSRPASTQQQQQHRASRSLGDVLDWRTETNSSSTTATTSARTASNALTGPRASPTQIGTAESLYTPRSAAFPPLTLAPLVVGPVPDGPLAIPPRSPLRAWPLRGN